MSKKDSSFGFAMGILAGVVGGIVGGILFAPKSGEESRRELKEAIDEIITTYKKNSQCINRGRHSSDMATVNKYLDEHRPSSTEE